MIKLCVGVENIEDLQEWQDRRAKEARKAKKPPNPWHDTRMTPKRATEMLAGGSLYWVIKNRIIVRQRMVGFERVEDADGKAMCRIHLDPVLVRTTPRRKRPFQGWRYLEPDDAPTDLDGTRAALFEDIETALKEAMVW